MKRISCRLLTFAALLFATVFTSYADTRSGELLKRLYGNINGFGGCGVEFEVLAEGNTAEGVCSISGDKFYMRVEDMEVVGDGKAKYEINNVDEEVIIDKIDPKDTHFLANPARAFEFADESFIHDYKGEVVEQQKVCYKIELQPKDSNSPIRNITLLISKDTNLPVRLEYSVDGLAEDVEIVINKIGPEKGSELSIYTFDKKKYPGYEIIDFR